MPKRQLVIHKDFAARLSQEHRAKSFREERGIEAQEIAAEIGTSKENVSKWLAGKTIPRDKLMLKLAAYFGVTPGWLRYGQEPRYPAPVEPKLTIPRKRASGDNHDR